MKKFFVYLPICLLFFGLVFITSCFGQSSSTFPTINDVVPGGKPQTREPIAEYVVEIFEDSKGNFWFGTMNKGVARFDGRTLVYLSSEDGLCGNTVTSVVEDKQGNLWFGTHSGLSRYDGKTFTNFTTKDGLRDNRVSNLLIDRAGNFWLGTWGGVCQYDGIAFTDFPVPVPEVELHPYQTTMNWITDIQEDRQGNIWFGRDGYGACMYDGKSFRHFTKKDGLPSNNVQAIQEDRQGNIWFGCRVAERDNPDPKRRTGNGGLCRYDGHTIRQYPGWEGLSKNDIYSIFTDKAGNIWIGANGVGVYRYDGESFKIFKGTDRMDLTYGFGVQRILEDKNGRLWVGFSGGLFRLDGTTIVHVSADDLMR